MEEFQVRSDAYIFRLLHPGCHSSSFDFLLGNEGGTGTCSRPTTALRLVQQSRARDLLLTSTTPHRTPEAIREPLDLSLTIEVDFEGSVRQETSM